MFDLRYHVASLAAVFVALLIGILVGVGLTGKVDDAEKNELRRRIVALQTQVEAAGERRANADREE
ncbi:MAG: copper transporter, partial [Gaiellaceae bacterium]